MYHESFVCQNENKKRRSDSFDEHIKNNSKQTAEESFSLVVDECVQNYEESSDETRLLRQWEGEQIQHHLNRNIQQADDVFAVSEAEAEAGFSS